MLGIDITDPWGIVLAIISGSVCVAMLIYCVVPWLVQKKYPVTEWLNSISNATKKIETILTIVGKNDFTNKYSDKLELYNNIMNITKDAVAYSEQLYKTKELLPEQRKDFAIEYAKRALESGGIIVNHDIENLIVDCIEASVWAITKPKKLN